MLNLGGGARFSDGGWMREEVLDQSCCITTIASFVFTVGEGWYSAAAWEQGQSHEIAVLRIRTVFM
jgi:hypothetical protein